MNQSERLIADFGKRNTVLEEELRVVRSQVATGERLWGQGWSNEQN